MIWNCTDDSKFTLLPRWKDMNLSTAKHNAKKKKKKERTFCRASLMRTSRRTWDKMTSRSNRYDCSSLLCRLTTVSYARISCQCECVLLSLSEKNPPTSGGVLAIVTTNDCKPLPQGCWTRKQTKIY